MNTKEYQAFVEWLCAPGSGIKPRLNTDQMGVVMHAVLGITSEAGEIADAVKKWVAYGREIDKVNLLEEMGDLVHFITMMCVAQGFTLEQVVMANVNKLKERYPEGFSEQSALNRDVTKERETLERDANES